MIIRYTPSQEVLYYKWTGREMPKSERPSRTAGDKAAQKMRAKITRKNVLQRLFK